MQVVMQVVIAAKLSTNLTSICLNTGWGALVKLPNSTSRQSLSLSSYHLEGIVVPLAAQTKFELESSMLTHYI